MDEEHRDQMIRTSLEQLPTKGLQMAIFQMEGTLEDPAACWMTRRFCECRLVLIRDVLLNRRDTLKQWKGEAA